MHTQSIVCATGQCLEYLVCITLPTGSETGQNFAWLWKNHPPDLRKHSVMLYTKNNGNVLTKNYLLKMFDGKNQNKLLNLLHINILFVNFANSNRKED